ncbi:MAG: site-2 protease family protein [Acidobacteria bacterium]|nr:site-2 protease family protein [Acidobacteriota bacterium]
MRGFDLGNAVFLFVIFLFSTVLHELAHAAMAYYWGDTTARDDGRLTLNPMPHIDPFGTILLPIIMLFMSGGNALMGYATTPVNESRMRDPKWGGFWTSFAGPLANLAIAIISVILLKLAFSALGGNLGDYRETVVTFLAMSVSLNLLLLVFNLLPIPPLDGGHMLRNLLPDRFGDFFNQIGVFGMFIVLALASSGILGKLVDPLERLSFSLIR